MKFHFIGIKGSGMSALAILLNKKGFYVQGSDTTDYIFTQENLLANKIKTLEFNADNLKKIDVVICGHAFIDSDNIELVEAKKRGMTIYEYNHFIAMFIKDYKSVAISGAHGKTTTTSLVYNVLNSKYKTGYLIGDGTASISKKSEYFVFEACEYKDHFLVYEPNIVVINNVELDHVDYFKSEEQFRQAFYNFALKAKDKVVINGDDKNLKKLKLNNLFRFGLKRRNDVYAKKIKQNQEGISYDLYFHKKKLQRVFFPFYGRHMVYNTLAAISVGLILEIELEKIVNGINNFKGVKRRFKETIINDDVYIDDYAHHPSKIRAIISAVRQKYPHKELIAFFRGDRYSRIKMFGKEIAKELSKADESYVLPFPLSSKKEDNIDVDESYIASFNKKIKVLKETDEEYRQIALKKNVVYLMMSSKNMLETMKNIQKYKG